MAVGILLVTHSGIGSALVATASGMLHGNVPLKLEAFEVPFDGDPDTLLPQASAAMRRVDGGDGVLILTDLFGATPSNVAMKLLEKNRIEAVSGVNLPMLLRALTYREKDFRTLIQRAVSGACDGVVHIT